jgi:hypothetical protein
MRIVVICGAQRSGTTLVQTLVANALPNAPILPESHILVDLMRAWKRAKSEWRKTSRFYATPEEAARFFRSTVETHLHDIQRRYPDAEFLVLKEPNLVETLDEVVEILPDAVRIVCLRDPRDIVASYLKIGERQVALRQKTHYTRREVDFICKKINRSYKRLIDEVPPPRIATLRYEEVATDPADALRRLAADTGLPLEPIRFDALVWLEDEYRHQETWRTELEGRPPTATSVGSFRLLLAHREIAQVETMCRPLFDRFSYRADSNGSATAATLAIAKSFLGRKPVA